MFTINQAAIDSNQDLHCLEVNWNISAEPDPIYQALYPFSWNQIPEPNVKLYARSFIWVIHVKLLICCVFSSLSVYSVLSYCAGKGISLDKYWFDLFVRFLVAWVQWIALWRRICAVNRKSRVILHVSIVTSCHAQIKTATHDHMM